MKRKCWPNTFARSQFEHVEAVHPALPLFNERYASFLDMDPALICAREPPFVGYMLWLMDLSEEDILSIARRLDFTSNLTHAVWAAAQLKKGAALPCQFQTQRVDVCAWKNCPCFPFMRFILLLARNALLSYLSMWRHVKPIPQVTT
jgi:hypothetical protein